MSTCSHYKHLDNLHIKYHVSLFCMQHSSYFVAHGALALRKSALHSANLSMVLMSDCARLEELLFDVLSSVMLSLYRGSPPLTGCVTGP